MTVLTDIKRMQVEGKTEAEILSTLKQQGVSPREITEALSQSKIREAVAGESPYGNPEAALMPPQEQAAPAEEMVPSVAAPQGRENYPQPYEQQYQQAQAPAPQQQPQYQQYPQQYEPQYQTYQPQPQMGAISPDTITEISEQVVAEKLSPLRKDIEKVIDLKTTMESKMEYLDERLKRIEKIIDLLQLSIMQKVGEYITNIDDIKKEITETQKSFKAMVPGLPASSKEERAEKPKKLKDEVP